MKKTFCDGCHEEIPEHPSLRLERGMKVLGDFCSFGCLMEWATNKHVMSDEPAPGALYGPVCVSDAVSVGVYRDSDRRDPELLMEAADNERKARRES